MILTINCGSSTIKYQLFTTDVSTVVAKGIISRIGEEGSYFEQEARETDESFEVDGLRVFVDPVSARYLEDVVIDYVFGMNGAGFKFNNPKATGTCGCGSSFAV